MLIIITHIKRLKILTDFWLQIIFAVIACHLDRHNPLQAYLCMYLTICARYSKMDHVDFTISRFCPVSFHAFLCLVNYYVRAKECPAGINPQSLAKKGKNMLKYVKYT